MRILFLGHGNTFENIINCGNYSANGNIVIKDQDHSGVKKCLLLHFHIYSRLTINNTLNIMILALSLSLYICQSIMGKLGMAFTVFGPHLIDHTDLSCKNRHHVCSYNCILMPNRKVNMLDLSCTILIR